MPWISNESIGDAPIGASPLFASSTPEIIGEAIEGIVASAGLSTTAHSNVLVSEVVASIATLLGGNSIVVDVVDVIAATAALLNIVEGGDVIDAVAIVDVASSSVMPTVRVTERIRADDIVVYLFAAGARLIEPVSAVDLAKSAPGGKIVERPRLVDTLRPQWMSRAQIVQRLRVGDSLVISIPAGIVELLGAADVAAALSALRIIEQLGVADQFVVQARRQGTIRERMRVGAELLRFFSADLAESIAIDDAAANVLRAIATIAEPVVAAANPAHQLLVRAVAAEHVEVTAEQIVNALYGLSVLDGVEVTAGYLAPDAQFSTWVMNTRTAAVSEYSGFEFNSFARVGNKYIGAAADGIYELLGDTDDGTDIVSTVRGGFLQFGGTRLSRLKAAYIAARGEGEMLLKITTGDGKDYVYRVDTRDMRSTKVHMGKGQRARYFAFELVSAGQEFDLESIEFVPIVLERRV